MRICMKRIICIALCAILCLGGCAGVELTDSETGMISEYAAYVVLKHNRLYHARLQDEVVEAETEAELPTAVVTPAQDGTAGNSGNAGNTEQESLTLSDALGLEGLEAEYKDYEIMDAYADEYFSFSATEGKVLLVLHFDITNQTGTEQQADVLKSQLKFRCTVNHEKRVGSQLTMLTNDLYSFKEMLAPQEKEDAVLIFQLPEDYRGNVEALELTVKNGEESHKYILE